LTVVLFITPRTRIKGFNAHELVIACDQKDIHYVHMSALGNINYNTGGPIELVDPEPGIKWLKSNLIRGKNVVLMCTCRDSRDCHRTYITQILQRQLPSLAVIHL